jgi:hypothetical protein
MKDIEESNKKTYIRISKKLAESYNIEIVNYDTFYDDLPQRDKENTYSTFFSQLLKPRIVFNTNMYSLFF